MTERTLVAPIRATPPRRARTGLVLATVMTCQLMLILDAMHFS